MNDNEGGLIPRDRKLWTEKERADFATLPWLSRALFYVLSPTGFYEWYLRRWKAEADAANAEKEKVIQFVDYSADVQKDRKRKARKLK